MDNLKPCPFCGGKAEIIHIDEGENAGGSCVCCTQCMASGNVEFEFKENFVSNWNRRSTLKPEGKQISHYPAAEVVGELDALRKFAHEATKTITGLTAGGSEYFAGKIGDIFVADLPFCAERIRERDTRSHERLITAIRERNEARAALSTPTQAEVREAAEMVLTQVEELFPNWRSYRDLVDCIECTLHELRTR